MPYSGPPISTTHHYRPAPGSWAVTPPCAECDFPKGSRVHDVPELPDEVRAVGERIVGEGRTDG